jgi:hypothetical protein
LAAGFEQKRRLVILAGRRSANRPQIAGSLRSEEPERLERLVQLAERRVSLGNGSCETASVIRKTKQEAAGTASCNQKPLAVALELTMRRIDRRRGYMQQLLPQAAVLAHLHLPLVAQPHLQGQVTPFLVQSHTPVLAQPQSQGQAAALAQLHLPLVAQPHLQGQVTPFLAQSHTPVLAQPQSQGQPPACLAQQQHESLSVESPLA